MPRSASAIDRIGKAGVTTTYRPFRIVDVRSILGRSLIGRLRARFGFAKSNECFVLFRDVTPDKRNEKRKEEPHQASDFSVEAPSHDRDVALLDQRKVDIDVHAFAAEK